MTTQSKSSKTSRGLLPWRKRAEYKPSKSRRKREKQLQNQKTTLYLTLGATVVVGIIVILINWQNAGAAKAVSCEDYPQYCLPMANFSDDYTAFESAGVRELDQEPDAPAGVVRGLTDDNTPFLGDPNAPIHIRTVSNFACSHCNTYHTGDLEQFIEDYVLTGQATASFTVVTSSAAPAYAQVASEAAYCAGEQGAFWEMSDELYRIARAYGVGGFTMGQIEDSADDMGLDSDDLVSCVASGKYAPLIIENEMFMQDNGITGTPGVLVRYTGDDEWTRLGNLRGYASLADMTERANAAQ